MIEMSSSTSILNRIKERPGMYLGCKSLTALSHFMRGYHEACCSNNFDNNMELQIPKNFYDWCAYRTHFEESTSGWCNMICSVTNSEESAFDYFFKLLDEYKLRKPNKVARVSGLDKTYTIVKGGEQQEVKYPSSIALITYTDDPGFFAESEIEGKSFFGEGFFPYLDWFERSLGIKRESITILEETSFLRLSK